MKNSPLAVPVDIRCFPGLQKAAKAKGYIVVAGKISTKFLAEKIYGMKVED